MVAHIINAENIVATYLHLHPEKDFIALETIYHIKEKLEKTFRKKKIFVYVDQTRDAIYNIMHISPNLFVRDTEKTKIILKDRKAFDDDMPYFNAKIDREIRKTYLELMETICKDVK